MLLISILLSYDVLMFFYCVMSMIYIKMRIIYVMFKAFLIPFHCQVRDISWVAYIFYFLAIIQNFYVVKVVYSLYLFYLINIFMSNTNTIKNHYPYLADKLCYMLLHHTLIPSFYLLILIFLFKFIILILNLVINKFDLLIFLISI